MYDINIKSSCLTRGHDGRGLKSNTLPSQGIGIPEDVVKMFSEQTTEKTFSTDCIFKNQTLIPYSRNDLRTASTMNSVLFRNEVVSLFNNSFILSVKILGIEIESYSFVMIIEYKLHLLKIMMIICGNCADPDRYSNDQDREEKIDLNMSIIFCIIMNDICSFC